MTLYKNTPKHVFSIYIKKQEYKAKLGWNHIKICLTFNIFVPVLLVKHVPIKHIRQTKLSYKMITNEMCDSKNKHVKKNIRSLLWLLNDSLYCVFVPPPMLQFYAWFYDREIYELS